MTTEQKNSRNPKDKSKQVYANSLFLIMLYKSILTEAACSVACNYKKVISLLTSTTSFPRIPVKVLV